MDSPFHVPEMLFLTTEPQYLPLNSRIHALLPPLPRRLCFSILLVYLFVYLFVSEQQQSYERIAMTFYEGSRVVTERID